MLLGQKSKAARTYTECSPTLPIEQAVASMNAYHQEGSEQFVPPIPWLSPNMVQSRKSKRLPMYNCRRQSQLCLRGSSYHPTAVCCWDSDRFGSTILPYSINHFNRFWKFNYLPKTKDVKTSQFSYTGPLHHSIIMWRWDSERFILSLLNFSQIHLWCFLKMGKWPRTKVTETSAIAL